MPEKGAGAPSGALRISLTLHWKPVTASHLRLFFGAGHYALKVDNDGLTRRRGGRGELHGDWSFIRHASLRGLRASA